MKKLLFVLILAIFVFTGCQKKEGAETKIFPKNSPQPLNYENISIVLKDRKQYFDSVKNRDQKLLREIDQRYEDVYFEFRSRPLLRNLYPDPEKGRIIHIVEVKDPETESDFVLQFDKKLPVIDSNSISLALRLSIPNGLLLCPMEISESSGYVDEYRNHEFQIRFRLFARFSPSGSFGFDPLPESTAVAARNGLFFEIVEAELSDLTANIVSACRMTSM